MTPYYDVTTIRGKQYYVFAAQRLIDHPLIFAVCYVLLVWNVQKSKNCTFLQLFRWELLRIALGLNLDSFDG